MLTVVLLLYLCRSVVTFVDEEPYCALRYRRLCQGKGGHVACQFTSPGPGLSCQNYKPIKFTNDLRHFIVNYINRRRQRIASGNERVRGGARLPRPEIMMLVSWDRELAHLAQRLADQCQFVHDDCRATVRYPYAGQSVGEVRWRRTSDPDELTAKRAIRKVFDAWWGERRRVLPKQIIAPFRHDAKGSVWGHFSQLAVWTLRAVGCGAVRHGAEYIRLLLVCDFSHTNMLGQRTLTPGPLSPCPMHTTRRPMASFPLLCAPVRKPRAENLDAFKDDDEDDDDDDEDGDGEDDEYSYREEEERSSTSKKPNKQTTTIERSYFVVKHEDAEKGKYKVDSLRRMDKVEQDSETVRNEQVTLKKYYQWETRRPDFDRIRDENERKSDSRNLESIDGQDLKIEYVRMPTRQDIIMNQGLNSRTRWKQTRRRPLRPGANALLNKPHDKAPQRSTIAPFKLDDDDVDQLFRDTGFNINWRKPPAKS